MDILTPESIRKKIETLQEDNLECERVMRSRSAEFREKAECRMRFLRNGQELVHLHTTLVLLQNDMLMQDRHDQKPRAEKGNCA